MKKNLFSISIAVVIILILIIVGFMVFKKGGDGDACKEDKDCASNMKCAANICTSGKIGSFCSQKDQCQSKFCVKSKCTEGKEGSLCSSYKDCQNNMLCINSVCKNQPPLPAYTKYLDRIELQKINLGSAPGPKNIPVATTDFKVGDGINVDMQFKKDIKGNMYFDMVDSTTGEKIFMFPEFEATGAIGRGFAAPSQAGQYDLNIYFNKELITTISFTVSKN